MSPRGNWNIERTVIGEKHRYGQGDHKPDRISRFELDIRPWKRTNGRWTWMSMKLLPLRADCKYNWVDLWEMINWLVGKAEGCRSDEGNVESFLKVERSDQNSAILPWLYQSWTEANKTQDQQICVSVGCIIDDVEKGRIHPYLMMMNYMVCGLFHQSSQKKLGQGCLGR